jgi:hypothetical protein
MRYFPAHAGEGIGVGSVILITETEGRKRVSSVDKILTPPLTQSLTPNPSPKGEGNSDDPIIINSGYRSEAVNKAVGGAKGSNHLTGCAADIRVADIGQALRYAVILLDISDDSREDFDELLLERSPRGTYWLHFAVRPSVNRRKVRLIQSLR